MHGHSAGRVRVTPWVAAWVVAGFALTPAGAVLFGVLRLVPFAGIFLAWGLAANRVWRSAGAAPIGVGVGLLVWPGGPQAPALAAVAVAAGAGLMIAGTRRACRSFHAPAPVV